jgi:hypothetical protein
MKNSPKATNFNNQNANLYDSPLRKYFPQPAFNQTELPQVE